MEDGVTYTSENLQSGKHDVFIMPNDFCGSYTIANFVRTYRHMALWPQAEQLMHDLSMATKHVRLINDYIPMIGLETKLKQIDRDGEPRSQEINLASRLRRHICLFRP